MTDPSGTPVPEELAASVQHLELIGYSIKSLCAKVKRLEGARADTLRQIAEASKRVADGWSPVEILALYDKLNCPGLFTAWVAAGLPHPTRLRASIEMAIRHAPNDPASGGWVGEYENGRFGKQATLGPRPPDGTPVVYVLYGADAEPIYCGSTEHFKQRLKAHYRDGKRFVAWRAVPCANREQAYILEDRLLKQSCPPLNRRAGR
jgi:hypothetical protein